MTLIPRTLPTRLGAEDKFIDLYVIGLTFFQVLNALGGAAIAWEVLADQGLAGIPLGIRQVVAASAVLIGVWAAFWRHEGRSVWAWLWRAGRLTRLPRHAVSRPAALVLVDAPDNRWYEVRPALAWSDPAERDANLGRRA
jgi:hypothetical protein